MNTIQHNSATRRLACALPLLFGLLFNTVWAGGAELKQVDIQKFQFIPQEITINVGETIRWTNQEKRQYHSVWFEQAGDPEPAYFFPGETYDRSFDAPGTYPYRCGPHPKMTGIVHVK
jgi:plastocyanin